MIPSKRHMQRIAKFTIILGVAILTTIVRGEDRLGTGLLCTRLVDSVTVSMGSKRMHYEESVVVVTHQARDRTADDHSYGHFFVLPLYRVEGDGPAAIIDGGLPKISVSSGTVTGLRYESGNGITRHDGRWVGANGVYIFDVLFVGKVPDKITFTVEMTAAMEEMGPHSQVLCSLSSDGLVETESDRKCSLRVVGPNGGVGAVVDEQTAVKANKEGWCVVVPDKYYALRFLQ